jgi:cysteine-rich repeat protein
MHASIPSSPGAKRLLALLLLASAPLIACGSDSDPEPSGTVCGGVERDGQCLQRCDDSVCTEGNVCVFTTDRLEGYCSIACEQNQECPMGFACYNDVELASGETGTYCLNLGLPEFGAPGAACESNQDCDAGHGLGCFQSTCAFACSSVLSTCPSGMMCKGDPDATPDGNQGYCVAAPEDFGIPGRYGTECPVGNAQCDTDAGFVCIGSEGNADANCSKPDGCDTDTDCPSGYWCGATRVAADGEIDFSTQPKTCLRRGFCDPCETDIDCSHSLNAICVPDVNGEKFCSTSCTPGTDSCVIGASCDSLDDGRTACRPDVGICHTEEPQGCSPCRIDPDCGPNSMCLEGKWGYKPAMKWCSTPCGPADEFGKNTCPTAPNGLEMLCMDENMYGLGGPFTSSATPAYLYKHCYAPLTVDNTELFPDEDPPNNVCGNAKVDEGEECDDGNDKDDDGCASCAVTTECTFTITEPNDDDNFVLSPAPNHMSFSGPDYDPALPNVISTGICRTFKIEGAIETAGDVDVVAIMLPNGGDLWVDTFTSTVGACTADLTTEARVWKDGEKTTDEVLLDLSIPCEDLSDSMEPYATNGQACPGSPTHLGCGTCDGPGTCGVCDIDSGIGDCNRMLVSTATSLSGYPIYFDGRYKVLRVYANDAAATVGNFILIGSRFIAQADFSASTPPTLGCY